MTIYRGDTWPKKLARYQTHALARSWLAGFRDDLAWNAGAHLVLSSQEGGDLATLRGLGAPLENVWAIDRDAEALNVAKRRWGGLGVHWIIADAEAAPLAFARCAQKATGNSSGMGTPFTMSDGREMGCPQESAGPCAVESWAVDSAYPKISTVFWDFFGPMCIETVRACVLSWRALPFGSVMAVAVLKSRERDQHGYLDLPKWQVRVPGRLGGQLNRSMRRAMHAIAPPSIRLAKAMLNNETPWNGNTLLKTAMREFSSIDAGYVRGVLLWTLLVCAAPEAYPEVLGQIEYTSTDTQTKGSPMLILSFAKVTPDAAMTSPSRWGRVVCTEEVWKSIRDQVLDYEQAADLLNLEKGSVAALRAHKTRRASRA